MRQTLGLARSSRKPWHRGRENGSVHRVPLHAGDPKLRKGLIQRPNDAWDSPLPITPIHPPQRTISNPPMSMLVPASRPSSMTFSLPGGPSPLCPPGNSASPPGLLAPQGLCSAWPPLQGGGAISSCLSPLSGFEYQVCQIVLYVTAKNKAGKAGGGILAIFKGLIEKEGDI